MPRMLAPSGLLVMTGLVVLLVVFMLVKRETLALGLVVGVYVFSHALPVTKVLAQLDFGWEASCAVAQIAFETLWHGRPDWLWVFGWLPNPLLWLGVACLWIGRRRDARRTGIAAGLIGCLAFAGASLWFFNADVNDDLLSGYYVWAASMGMLALVGFWNAMATRHATPSQSAGETLT
jgi:hypothetical protein